MDGERVQWFCFIRIMELFKTMSIIKIRNGLVRWHGKRKKNRERYGVIFCAILIFWALEAIGVWLRG